MYDKIPESIVRKRYDKIDKALKRLTTSFAPEDIHRFRLQVKKLRSYLSLAGTGKQKSNRLKLPTKLHQFYHVIGFVRNLQLQQQRITPLDHAQYSNFITHYLLLISKDIDYGIVQAMRIVRRKKTFTKERDRLLAHLPSKLKKATCQKFTRQHLEELKELLQPSSLSDDALHAVRKLLKDVLYTWHYTNKVKSSIPVPEWMSMEEISTIIKMLGSFHDKCEALDLLHIHYKQQESDSDQRLMWRMLENSWWQEKEIERVDIHTHLQKELALLLPEKQPQQCALPLPVKQLTL
jgi:CHAD domain-containing protein